MNRLLATITAGLVAAGGVAATATAGASARTATGHATTTSTSFVPNPPIQSRHRLPLSLYVDTVEGGGGSPKPAVTCAMTNLFVKGQVVVFRMWGNDAVTGGTPLTDHNVKGAYVTIPGVGKIPLTYGAHGTYPNKRAFWTAAWSTGSYPSVGAVNFTVTVITKPVKQWGMKSGVHSKIGSQTGIFSQAGMSPSSQLTIT